LTLLPAGCPIATCSLIGAATAAASRSWGLAVRTWSTIAVLAMNLRVQMKKPEKQEL